MPSFRARLINFVLRRYVKRMWRPGITIEAIRAHTPGRTGALRVAPSNARWSP